MKMTTIRIGTRADLPVLEFLYNYVYVYRLQGCKCTKFEFEFPNNLREYLFL